MNKQYKAVEYVRRRANLLRPLAKLIPGNAGKELESALSEAWTKDEEFFLECCLEDKNILKTVVKASCVLVDILSNEEVQDCAPFSVHLAIAEFNREANKLNVSFEKFFKSREDLRETVFNVANEGIKLVLAN